MLLYCVGLVGFVVLYFGRRFSLLFLLTFLPTYVGFSLVLEIKLLYLQPIVVVFGVLSCRLLLSDLLPPFRVPSPFMLRTIFVCRVCVQYSAVVGSLFSPVLAALIHDENFLRRPGQTGYFTVRT